MSAVPTHSSDTLCLQCGLCCNGVLFADVKLRPADDPERLKAGGLPVRGKGKNLGFAQPCAALQPDGKCCVYQDRPAMCRQFECGVLKGFCSSVILKYLDFQDLPRKAYLYDTFEGLPEKTSTEEELRLWRYKTDDPDEIYNGVCKTFSRYGNVKIVRGIVPDSFEIAARWWRAH